MKKVVSQYLLNNGSYSKQDVVLLEEKLQLKKLNKGDFLLKKGELCSSVYFIVEGDLFRYRIEDEVNIKVLELRTANEWILDHQSFVKRTPADSYIKAFTNALTYELTMDAIHDLISKSTSFFQLGTILESSNVEMMALQQLDGPDAKYHYVLDNRPELLQRFPLKMIASYLNMTPETLSRVRKRMF